MGQGNKELEASIEADLEQSFRDTIAAISRTQDAVVDLYYQSRKLSLAIRTREELRQFGDRREFSFQRSIHKTIQSLKEALEGIQETLDFDGNPLTPEHSGSVGPSGDIGYGTTVRNFLNEVQRQVPDAGQNQPAHQGGIQLRAQTGGSGTDSYRHIGHLFQPTGKGLSGASGMHNAVSSNQPFAAGSQTVRGTEEGHGAEFKWRGDHGADRGGVGK